jgi:hypothetical protein
VHLFRSLGHIIIKRCRSIAFTAALTFSLSVTGAVAQAGVKDGTTALWAHDNLVAWCVSPWDAKKRGPEELAQMLEKLGFKHFSFISLSDDSTAELDAQIEALQRHGIELTAAYLMSDPDAPVTKRILEVLKRRGIHPQLWVSLSPKNLAWPKTQAEWRQLVPDAPLMPTDLASATLSEAQHSAISHRRPVACNSRRSTNSLGDSSWRAS